jgi:predicted DNA-binding protein with PD1-like motif
MGFIQAKPGKIVMAKLSPGEDLQKSVIETAQKAGISSGVFLIIGTLKQVTMGFYSPVMTPVTIKEPLEIVSCIGNIAKREGSLASHAHITVTDSKLHSYGGHMLEGCTVDRVAELTIFELAGVALERTATGLSL